jgi:hypothetical protein
MGSRSVWGSLVVAVLVLSGCSASVSVGNELETAEAEQLIADDLEEQSDKTWSVECPDEVKVEEGGEFECSAEADDGETVTAKVTQDDDEGNVSWTYE